MSHPSMDGVAITIAAGTYDGVLAGWELPGRRRTLRLLFASPVHGGSVRGLAPATTGGAPAAVVAAKSDDKTKRNSSSGGGGSHKAHRLLVSCGYDESVQLHNFTRRRTSAGQLRTPAELGTPVCLQLAPPPPPLGSAAAAPSLSSTHCLVGFASGRLALYQRKDWSLVHVLAPGHVGGVASVAVHPSGRLALSGGRADGRLQLWDLQTGKAAYGHTVQPPPARTAGGGRSAGPPRREPIDTIVWSPAAADAEEDEAGTAGTAYAYCHGSHVTVRDVASGRDLLDVELPSRVNQICFLRPGDEGAGLFLAAAGNDGSLAVLKVGRPGDRSVERRAIMAIEPVDRAVAGEERFKCLQHIMGTIVATANSAGVISVMDLKGAIRMINAQPDGDDEAEQEETPVDPESEEDESDDDGSVELAVDIIDSIQLGTGARITCLAAWAEEVDDKDSDETSESPRHEKEVPAESIDDSEGHKRKRPPSSKDIVLAKDALERARELVSDAKKIQIRKEKKRHKKRHGL